jgi:CRISPR system Cascade subunit CasE
MWALFADGPERKRDFLWREAESGVFYTLSERPPVDSHCLFDVDPPKPFQPSFAAGDRLQFMLRANATVARGGAKGTRGKPCDVVMDAIFRLPTAERADRRRTAVEESGRAWLVRQGERGGFTVDVREVRVPSYQVLRVEHSGPQARLGVLDLEGVLTVTDPARFIERVRTGFGRAKAFGCGLMLLRRA